MSRKEFNVLFLDVSDECVYFEQRWNLELKKDHLVKLHVADANVLIISGMKLVIVC